jgi:hypothetical protein
MGNTQTRQNNFTDTDTLGFDPNAYNDTPTLQIGGDNVNQITRKILENLNLPDISEMSDNNFDDIFIKPTFGGSNKHNDGLSDTSPFITSDMYNHLMKGGAKNTQKAGGNEDFEDSSTSSTSDSESAKKPKKEKRALKNKRKLGKKKHGGASENDSESSSSSVSSISVSSSSSSSESDKKHEDEKHLKRKEQKHHDDDTSSQETIDSDSEDIELEDETELDYLSSSAHEGGAASSSVSISHARRHYASSINTSDINLIQ